jgi:hypothetical protein
MKNTVYLPVPYRVHGKIHWYISFLENSSSNLLQIYLKCHHQNNISKATTIIIIKYPELVRIPYGYICSLQTSGHNQTTVMMIISSVVDQKMSALMLTSTANVEPQG